MTLIDTCPITPTRHQFPTRAAAWAAVRGAADKGDTFRVYRCNTCRKWHWHRLISLRTVKNEH